MVTEPVVDPAGLPPRLQLNVIHNCESPIQIPKSAIQNQISPVTTATPYLVSRNRTLASAPGYVSFSVANSPYQHHHLFTKLEHNGVNITPQLVVIHGINVNKDSRLRSRHSREEPAPQSDTGRDSRRAAGRRGPAPRRTPRRHERPLAHQEMNVFAFHPCQCSAGACPPLGSGVRPGKVQSAGPFVIPARAGIQRGGREAWQTLRHSRRTSMYRNAAGHRISRAGLSFVIPAKACPVSAYGGRKSRGETGRRGRLAGKSSVEPRTEMYPALGSSFPRRRESRGEAGGRVRPPSRATSPASHDFHSRMRPSQGNGDSR